MEVLENMLVMLATWFFFYMQLLLWRKITGYGREK